MLLQTDTRSLTESLNQTDGIVQYWQRLFDKVDYYQSMTDWVRFRDRGVVTSEYYFVYEKTAVLLFWLLTNLSVSIFSSKLTNLLSRWFWCFCVDCESVVSSYIPVVSYLTEMWISDTKLYKFTSCSPWHNRLHRRWMVNYWEIAQSKAIFDIGRLDIG